VDNRRNFLNALGGMLALGVAANGQPANKTRVVTQQPLPEPFQGYQATIIEVDSADGPGWPAHRHSGFVLGYVLEGEFRFQLGGEAERTLHAGEAFYEPPGSVHAVSASARPGKTARVLAIVIAEVGKPTALPL
jgi:quercetin dioxygenase-like cupin family protein